MITYYKWPGQERCRNRLEKTETLSWKKFQDPTGIWIWDLVFSWTLLQLSYQTQVAKECSKAVFPWDLIQISAMHLLSQGVVRLSYALLQNNKVHNHGRGPPSSLPQSWPDWWLWLVMTAYYQWPGKGRCRNTTTFLHYAATWVQYLSGRSFWLEIKRSRVQIPAGSRIFF